MIFQSRFENHTFQVRPTVRIYHPGFGFEIKPGLRASFKGRSRLFDSEEAQLENGWTDEERIQVEDKLLGCKSFGKEIFMAPGEIQKLDEATIAKMRVRPKTQVQRCTHVVILKGEVFQCSKEATAGREYCAEHDPKTQRIVRGAVEQK